MLQHQIVQSPARLGLVNPSSPSVQNPTPPRHPTSSSSSQSQHQQIQQQQQPPNLSAAAPSVATSATLLPLLPPLPRAQALLLQMTALASKLFDVSSNRSVWRSAVRGSLPSFLSSHSLPSPPPLENPNPSSTKEILSLFNSLQTQLFEAVTELQGILDLQDAKQKIAREVKSKDSSLLAFANKLREAERVLDVLVDDYSDYRRPKRTKTAGDSLEEEGDESSLSSSNTTVAFRIKLKDILSYAHRISYTTFAPPEFGAGQAPLRGALPPAPQDEQMRASQLYNFADLDVGLPKVVENEDKKVEALVEPPPPLPESIPADYSGIQGLLPPNITIPSGWKPGMPVELPKDLPLPPPGWKPGDPVVLPPMESVPVPRADEQQVPPLPVPLHKPPEVIQVRPVQLDILEDDDSSDYSSDASSDDED